MSAACAPSLREKKKSGYIIETMTTTVTAIVQWTLTLTTTMTTVASSSGSRCICRTAALAVMWQMQKSCHLNMVDDTDQSHSMRPQRKHDSHEDGDCDSNSANDADVEDNSNDGGKHESKQLQQQQSSTSIGRYRRRHGQQCRLVYIIFTLL